MCFWSRQSAFGVNLYYLCDITFAAYVKVWGKLKFLGQVWEERSSFSNDCDGII